MIRQVYRHQGRFEFEAGGSIDNLEVVYHTSPWEYSPDKKVIGLCHALTASSDAEKAAGMIKKNFERVRDEAKGQIEKEEGIEVPDSEAEIADDNEPIASYVVL